MTVENLYNYVKSNLPKNKKAYLFFDEIQKIPEWQDAINSFRVDFECDIYEFMPEHSRHKAKLLNLLRRDNA